MRFFLDANVLISVLNKEYPAFPYTSRVLSLADNRRFKIYTSPLCLAIAFYFAEKKHGAILAKSKIDLLAQKISIAGCGAKETVSALQNKKIHDFEDGLQYYAAANSGCSCIVTADADDFYFSELEVLDAEFFLKKIS
jgi:predicted nucleic acid-binding protein